MNFKVLQYFCIDFCCGTVLPESENCRWDYKLLSLRLISAKAHKQFCLYNYEFEMSTCVIYSKIHTYQGGVGACAPFRGVNMGCNVIRDFKIHYGEALLRLP